MGTNEPEHVARKGCIANARELLRGAHGLLDRDGLPRLAYHLGVLALEEIGKARIIAMQIVAKNCGRELPSSVKAMDDHIRKLFWAIWGPSFGRELIDQRQIQENIGLATRLHEKRLGGLYVDLFDDGDVSLPTDAIPLEEASSLLRFADACLELAAAEEPDESSDQSTGTQRQLWFFEATEDPERRKAIMSRKSMEKLKELGSTPAWVDWLKDLFDKSEADARAALEAQLRKQPDALEDAKPKWRMTIRLYSASHSIRQPPLNVVSEGLNWIKLRSVSSKSNQMLVDLDAGTNVALDHLWRTNLLLSRRLVMALNVATLGYFWFHEPLDADPRQSGRYYERILDLETSMEVRAQRNPPLRLEFGRRRVLEDADLRRWLLVFGHLMRYRTHPEADMCERYLDGMTMSARSDAHMAFHIQSVAAFYLALQQAMVVHGDWTKGTIFRDAFYRFASEAFKKVDESHFDRLLAVGDSINKGPAPHAMDSNDVGVMKALCDVYLLRAAQKRPFWLDKEDGEGDTRPDQQ